MHLTPTETAMAAKALRLHVEQLKDIEGQMARHFLRLPTLQENARMVNDELYRLRGEMGELAGRMERFSAAAKLAHAMPEPEDDVLESRAAGGQGW
ncbi:MAG: hypothetical protein Q7U48_13845 [Hydrogenophaga sp.]|nr:hypothetical protein [Hydrogenophaga sp.]